MTFTFKCYCRLENLPATKCAVLCHTLTHLKLTSNTLKLTIIYLCALQDQDSRHCETYHVRGWCENIDFFIKHIFPLSVSLSNRSPNDKKSSTNPQILEFKFNEFSKLDFLIWNCNYIFLSLYFHKSLFTNFFFFLAKYIYIHPSRINELDWLLCAYMPLLHPFFLLHLHTNSYSHSTHPTILVLRYIALHYCIALVLCIREILFQSFAATA